MRPVREPPCCPPGHPAFHRPATAASELAKAKRPRKGGTALQSEVAPSLDLLGLRGFSACARRIIGRMLRLRPLGLSDRFFFITRSSGRPQAGAVFSQIPSSPPPPLFPSARTFPMPHRPLSWLRQPSSPIASAPVRHHLLRH